MTSTFTTNKSIEKPANGDYVNDWNVPVNTDWNIIDQAFGGTTSLNVTGVSTTPVNLTIDSVNAALSYQSLLLTISGTLSNNVTYTIPSGVGGQWIVTNGTTGAFSVIIASLGGGTSYAPPQGYKTIIVSDGTNISAAINTPTVGGANTQVQFNSSGILTGSPGLTWDGTNLNANQIVSANNISSGGSISSGSSVSDLIGNVRNVPANNQTSGYTLAATDNGKFIDITTGGITVPSGVFSTGQSVTIYNDSSSSQTIYQGTSVTMYWVGTSITGNRSLAQRGLATIFCVGTNVFIATGGGLS